MPVAIGCHDNNALKLSVLWRQCQYCFRIFVGGNAIGLTSWQRISFCIAVEEFFVNIAKLLPLVDRQLCEEYNMSEMNSFFSALTCNPLDIACELLHSTAFCNTSLLNRQRKIKVKTVGTCTFFFYQSSGLY